MLLWVAPYPPARGGVRRVDPDCDGSSALLEPTTSISFNCLATSDVMNDSFDLTIGAAVEMRNCERSTVGVFLCTRFGVRRGGGGGGGHVPGLHHLLLTVHNFVCGHHPYRRMKTNWLSGRFECQGDHQKT